MLPEIAIPSYKRSKTIKTLAFLKSVPYPSDKITIFVANDEEAQLYTQDVPKHLYGKIVVGVKGLTEQRNFITAYYPEDIIYIGMDDDVKKIDSNLPFLTLIQNAVDLLNTREALD